MSPITYVVYLRNRRTLTWWERLLQSFRQHWTRRPTPPFVPQRANIRDAAEEES